MCHSSRPTHLEVIRSIALLDAFNKSTSVNVATGIYIGTLTMHLVFTPVTYRRSKNNVMTSCSIYGLQYCNGLLMVGYGTQYAHKLLTFIPTFVRKSHGALTMPGMTLVCPIIAATICPRVLSFALALSMLQSSLKLVTQLFVLLLLLFGWCRIAQHALRGISPAVRSYLEGIHIRKPVCATCPCGLPSSSKLPDQLCISEFGSQVLKYTSETALQCTYQLWLLFSVFCHLV